MAKFCAISDLHGALPKIEECFFFPKIFIYQKFIVSLR